MNREQISKKTTLLQVSFPAWDQPMLGDQELSLPGTGVYQCPQTAYTWPALRPTLWDRQLFLPGTGCYYGPLSPTTWPATNILGPTEIWLASSAMDLAAFFFNYLKRWRNSEDSIKTSRLRVGRIWWWCLSHVTTEAQHHKARPFVDHRNLLCADTAQAVK